MPIFIFNPLQHLTTAIIIKVGIYIRKGYTIRVQETLKQQIILDWVYLGDAQAISHNRTRSRATPRTNHHAEFVTGRVDKILHNKEITRETHRLHHMQLKIHTFLHIIRYWIAIALFGSLIRQFGQIVGLKLYTVYLVISAQFLDFRFTLLRWNLVFTILIAGEFIIKLLLCKLLPPLPLGTETLRYREKWHDWRMLYIIKLHLV